MPFRALKGEKIQQWKDLAAVFERLLGGTPNSRKAAEYLRALADCRLPADAPPPLPWHEAPPEVEIMPQARQEPHPVVLAAMCPSVALRAVWKRAR